MTTAQLEAKCREFVASAIADGAAGKLDALVYRTLRDGLRRKRAAPPMISPGGLTKPNTLPLEQFAAIRSLFSGTLTPPQAKAVLGAAGRDDALPPNIRINAVVALLDLRLGRSVQSTMAFATTPD